jgi:hypothetical protein
MPRRPVALLSLCTLAILAGAGAAHAAAYLPPSGRIYAGITGADTAPYERQTGQHAAIYQQFVTWGGSFNWALSDADANRSRAMLAIQTITASGGEVISPGAIARGRGDRWLLDLAATLAQRGLPTYLRPMAEMDAYWNPYSAYNANGSSRGTAHSTHAFRQAWRRIALILRGGATTTIDAGLRRLRMPPVTTTQPTIAAAPVALMWVPQVAGAPDIPQNAPRAYYPGTAYVDYVGTDFYSKFPNWSGLDSFWAQFPSRPFVFGEWAIQGADNPQFVSAFFDWIRAHRRTRIIVYNQGYRPQAHLALATYPRAGHAVAAQLASPLFAPFTPDWRTARLHVNRAPLTATGRTFRGSGREDMR